MQFFKKKGVLTAGAGLAIGIINGLLGAGGGMIAVPLLQKLGLDRKQAHACIYHKTAEYPFQPH